MKLRNFLIITGILTVASAQVLMSIKDDGDVAINAIISDLEQKQAIYFQEEGTYWQGLETHGKTPKGLELSNLDTKPNDIKKTWREMGIPIEKLSRYSFRVDTYESPIGFGYTVTISTEIDDEIHIKTVNFGDETYRERDWRIVESP